MSYHVQHYEYHFVFPNWLKVCEYIEKSGFSIRNLNEVANGHWHVTKPNDQFNVIEIERNDDEYVKTDKYISSLNDKKMFKGTLKEKTQKICKQAFEDIKTCIQAVYSNILTEAAKESGYVKSVEDYLFERYGNGNVLNKGITHSTSIEDLSEAYNPFVITKQTMAIYKDDTLVDTVFQVDCDFSTVNLV